MIPEPTVIPRRLMAIRALQQHLQGINRAEGYNFDLGVERVLRNRVLLGDNVVREGLPLLSIVEAPRPDYAIFAGDWNDRRRITLTLLIQGIVADDKTADSEDDAHFLCHDVERRLLRCLQMNERGSKPMFPDEHMLGDIIEAMEIAEPVVRPPEAGVSAYHFFYLPVRLTMAGKIGE